MTRASRTALLAVLLTVGWVGWGCTGAGTGGGGAPAGAEQGDGTTPQAGSDSDDALDGTTDTPADEDETQDDQANGTADEAGTNGTPDTDDAGTDEDADEDTDGDTDQDEVPAFSLSSQSIAADSDIDLRFAYVTCGGNNISPHLSWTGAPLGTQGLLVVVFDKDAHEFIHWTVFNIPPDTRWISEGADPPPGEQSLNDYGVFGYGGPCPPTDERHTYVFRIFALDIADTGLTAGQEITMAKVLEATEPHILAKAEFQAAYTGP